MLTSKFGLIVIGDRRPDYFAESLPSDLEARFDLYNYPAVYPTSEEQDGYDLTGFRNRLGRDPLKGEIGCALAHREALKGFLDTSHTWVLILEDDAKLIKPGIFEEILAEVSIMPETQPAVISLCYERAFPKRNQNGRLMECRSFSSKTTAYFINRKGAEVLIASQTPVRFLADWPVTSRNLKFHVTRNPIFGEDLTLGSSISSADRLLSWSKTIQIYSGIWLIRKHGSFKGSGEYISLHIKPRLLYHLSSLNMIQSLGNR